MSIEVLLNQFKEASDHPYRRIKAYKEQGKKVIGVLPYYAPEELVYAAGMVPMGIWVCPAPALTATRPIPGTSTRPSMRPVCRAW